MSPCKFFGVSRSLFTLLLPCLAIAVPLRTRFSDAWCRHLAGGGDDGNRTHDPLLAGQVLSQLSYTPIFLGLVTNSHSKLNNNESHTRIRSYSSLVCLFGFALLKLRHLNALHLMSRSP